MYDHYGLSEDQWKSLQKKGVTIKDLFESVKLFGPKDGNPEAECAGVMSLFHYVDYKGDFSQPPKTLPHKLIAQAVFENLEIKEKISVAEYIELAENGYEEEDEDD